VRATRAFLTRLVRVPHWRTIPLTDAAQAVQRSATPDAYARWLSLAARLTGILWPAAAAANATAEPTRGVLSSVVLPVVVPAVACAGRDGAIPLTGGHGNNVAGSVRIPTGLVIDGSPAGQTAVRFAIAQLGKPYVFGAASPDALDCSGLTMAAWARAGVALPHSGTSGWSSGPGRRKGVSIQAPQDGIPVELTDAAEWTGQIVAVRHLRWTLLVPPGT
jgi:cell wall-associated NlpC family hydrolase